MYIASFSYIKGITLQAYNKKPQKVKASTLLYVSYNFSCYTQ